MTVSELATAQLQVATIAVQNAQGCAMIGFVLASECPPTVITSKEQELDLGARAPADLAAQLVRQGDTPLIVAARRGHLEWVSYLVGQGASLAAVNVYQQTPLLAASAMLSLLMQSLSSSKGKPPKEHDAVEWYKQIMALLVDECQPEDLLMSDGAGRTVLHLASAGGLEAQVAHILAKVAEGPGGQQRLAKLLAWRNVLGDTPLHSASRAVLYYKAQRVVMQQLVKAGADINATNAAQETPILLATCARHMEDVIYQLLDLGADPTLPDVAGNTVMHYCSQRAHEKLFSSILSRTGQHSCNWGGESSLEWALFNASWKKYPMRCFVANPRDLPRVLQPRTVDAGEGSAASAPEANGALGGDPAVAAAADWGGPDSLGALLKGVG